MKGTIEVNGSPAQLDGTRAEIADVIASMGGKRGRVSTAGAEVPSPFDRKPRGNHGVCLKYDDDAKRAVVAEAAKAKRAGMPAFPKAKGISYTSLGNWRTKFRKGKGS